MKSEEMILDITEKFGEEQKQELHKELKKFRHQVIWELLYKMERTVKQIKETYHKTGP